MGSSASIIPSSPATPVKVNNKKRKLIAPPNSPVKQLKKEERLEESSTKPPVNYRPRYLAASKEEKELWMCLSNTAKYCYSPWDIKRQCMLLDGFNMTENQMYGWMAFSYSVKCNFAQPSDGLSPVEIDTEPGLEI